MLIIAPAGAMAQSTKFTAAGRAQILLRPAASRGTDSDATSAFVRLKKGCNAAFLEGYGLSVETLGDDIAIARGTIGDLEAAAADRRVLRISPERKLRLDNDLSLAATGADIVKSGRADGADGTAYTGAGVVAGIFDNGFDVRNPSFSYRGEGASDSQSRIERMFIYADDGELLETYVAEDMADIATDDHTHYHGSHVLGTMAGCTGGQYDGYATGAVIATASGLLSDTNIAQGVKAIAEYAREQGLPCVINLSISDYIGPRDGTDDFSRALAAATYDTGDAILVLSSGNYRTNGTSISRVLSDDDPAVRTFIVPELWRCRGEGYLGIWSGDSRPLKLKMVVEDTYTETVLFEHEVERDASKPFVMATSDLTEEDLGVPFVTAEGFDTCADSSFVAVFYDDNAATNNRPNYYISYNLITDRVNNQYSRKPLGIIVEGEPGQRVDITLEGITTIYHDMWCKGWTGPSNDLSISSMAATKGAVVVGAYVTRTQWTNLDGSSEELAGHTVGEIAPWSSCGTLVDGRTLPHIAAPGAGVVSVLSGPYHTAVPDKHTPYAQAEIDGATCYWAVDYGTSMSAPAVAGGIALWLEADPTLTADDIHEILRTTAAPSGSDDAVAWGAGRFDANAGITEVLRRRAALAGPSAVEQSRVVAWQSGDDIEVRLEGADAFTAGLYDLSGRLMASAVGRQGHASMAAPAAGIYALRAGRFSTKVIVR